MLGRDWCVHVCVHVCLPKVCTAIERLLWLPSSISSSSCFRLAYSLARTVSLDSFSEGEGEGRGGGVVAKSIPHVIISS